MLANYQTQRSGSDESQCIGTKVEQKSKGSGDPGCSYEGQFHRGCHPLTVESEAGSRWLLPDSEHL